jgi:hypothetical protein
MKLTAQQCGWRLRQEEREFVDREVRVKLMRSLFVFAAVVVLLTAGHAGVARTPVARSATAGLGDVPEVVVTAERPAGLMPEVVVRANLMTEVVAYASRSTAEFSALPSALSFN